MPAVQIFLPIMFLIGWMTLPQPEIGNGHLAAAPSETARIRRVIDGDTIVTSQNIRIRYIGIDTPETHHPRRPVECLGKEATETNRKLVEGKIVILEKDFRETDRYGRQLRYVYLRNPEGRPSIFVNEELVARGLARARFYPPNIREKRRIQEAERNARNMKRGLWKLPPSRPQGKYRAMVLADPLLKTFFRPGTQTYENLRCRPLHLVYLSEKEAKKAGFHEGVP